VRELECCERERRKSTTTRRKCEAHGFVGVGTQQRKGSVELFALAGKTHGSKTFV
jgi:hypothetical protein